MPRPLRPLNPDLSPSHRLGAELRAFRIKAGETHGSLGVKVHASTSLIGSIERGERIGAVDVIALCDDELGARGALLQLWRVAYASRRKAGRATERRGSGGTPSQTTASLLERVLVQVESALAVRLDRASLEQRGGSIGVGTDRGTRVWIERRAADQVASRGWSRSQTALALDGVAMPFWSKGVTWRDGVPGVLWRADEVAADDYLVVEPDGAVLVDPCLPDSWWRTYSASLDALARYESVMPALEGGEPITESGVIHVIKTVWPTATTAEPLEWSSAHGALTWAKVTGPACFILDWTCWGRAPRGLDAARLWSCSLAVPEVADRVWAERRTDLESPTGRLMALYCLARILTDPHRKNGVLAEPARLATERLIRPVLQAAA